VIAATVRPSGSWVGRSLKLCIAMSAWFASRAFSSCEVKKPVDLRFQRAVLLSVSPEVVIVLTLNSM